MAKDCMTAHAKYIFNNKDEKTILTVSPLSQFPFASTLVCMIKESRKTGNSENQ